MSYAPTPPMPAFALNRTRGLNVSPASRETSTPSAVPPPISDVPLLMDPPSLLRPPKSNVAPTITPRMITITVTIMMSAGFIRFTKYEYLRTYKFFECHPDSLHFRIQEGSHEMYM